MSSVEIIKSRKMALEVGCSAQTYIPAQYCFLSLWYIGIGQKKLSNEAMEGILTQPFFCFTSTVFNMEVKSCCGSAGKKPVWEQLRLLADSSVKSH